MKNTQTITQWLNKDQMTIIENSQQAIQSKTLSGLSFSIYSSVYVAGRITLYGHKHTINWSRGIKPYKNLVDNWNERPKTTKHAETTQPNGKSSEWLLTETNYKKKKTK